MVRVAGTGAREQVARAFALAELGARPLELVRLSHEGTAIDEALAVVLGEELVELHVHGNPRLVESVLRALDPAAEPRAASQPASEAELAVTLLGGAPCEDGARILLDQVEGALGRELDRWGGLADESELRARAGDLVERSRVARFAWKPPLIVIAGPVNAGKSTLFNLLTGSERVVASEEEGTTRDAIREPAQLGRYPVELVDTAGTRALSDPGVAAQLEGLAQERARQWRERADLVLLLAPAGTELATPQVEGADPRVVCIPSRVDLLDLRARPTSGISALREPLEARRRIEAIHRRSFGLPERPWQPGRGVLLREEDGGRLAAALDGPIRDLRELLGDLRERERGAEDARGARH